MKYLIVGRTTSGKTTLENLMVQKLNLKPLKSYTTRKKRNKDDNSHQFITKDMYEKIDKSNIIVKTEINDNIYFATKEQLDESDIYVVDPKGVFDILSNTKNQNYTIIYLHRTKSNAEHLYNNRAKENDFEKRWKSEDKQFSNFEEFIYERFNYIEYKEKNNNTVQIIKIDENYGKVDENYAPLHTLNKIITFTEFVKDLKYKRKHNNENLPFSNDILYHLLEAYEIKSSCLLIDPYKKAKIYKLHLLEDIISNDQIFNNEEEMLFEICTNVMEKVIEGESKKENKNRKLLAKINIYAKLDENGNEVKNKLESDVDIATDSTLLKESISRDDVEIMCSAILDTILKIDDSKIKEEKTNTYH